jgi:hypothetical protein
MRRRLGYDGAADLGEDNDRPTRYRSLARIDGGQVKLLTLRAGFVASLSAHDRGPVVAPPEIRSYLDGELCAANAEVVPVFSRLQAAKDEDRTAELVGGDLPLNADKDAPFCHGALTNFVAAETIPIRCRLIAACRA